MADRLDAIEQRVRHAGAEVINLLKTGSAHYSPASGRVEKVFEIALTPSNDESAQERRHAEVRLHFRAKAAT